MTAKLLQIVESASLDADEIAARTKQIHAAVLNKSEHMDAPNFECIHPDDLKLLFTEYDGRFFEGQIMENLDQTQLEFGLSKRMTRSGGKTSCCVDRKTGERYYEISVSTTILFGCFTDNDHRPISGSGIVCHDRLDALQRIMEHELVHLVEFVLWGKSSCSKPRFHSITRRFLGHTENKHKLITPKERAVVQYGIKPGMAVKFRFDGVERRGFVNRINKRATVLVEDKKGQRYADGKHYAKFYVPVTMLEKVE